MELTKKHILVVEDDPALRILFQALLEHYGYSSETAEDGEAAETMLGQADYDAVLLDYMMPGIRGLTVLQHIQQRHAALPVVITGHAGGQAVSQALAAGALACLYKPFTCTEFEQVLKCIVGTAPFQAGWPKHAASITN